MTANVAPVHIVSDRIYPPKVYEDAAKDSSRTDEEIAVASTNVVLQVLGKDVIGPLSEIRDLAQQVKNRNINAGASGKIDGIFQAINFTPSKNKGPSLKQAQDRHDLALRTANLFRSEYKTELMALVLHLIHKGFSKEEALQSLLGAWSGGSLSDAVGSKAFEVFKEDTERQIQRQAAAEQRQAAADASIQYEESKIAFIKALRKIAEDVVERRST